MSQTSKYSNQDLDKVITALKVAIEAQKAPAALSMMALGETVADVIRHNYPEQKAHITEQFCQALKGILKDS